MPGVLQWLGLGGWLVSETIIPLRSQAGVIRDGTQLGNDSYIDALWARFQKGLPRKMGGYRSVNRYMQAIPRALHDYALNSLIYMHAGSSARLERLTLDSALNTSIISNRTPAALTASSNNVWQFDVAQKVGTGLQIVAQVAPNLTDIANNVAGQVFYGPITGTAALTQVTYPAAYSATGGVVYLAPYTMAFGSDGFVMFTTDPTDFTVAGAGNAYVTGQKIVRGLPLRAGGGNSPAGLLWSLDSLVRATYVGGTPVFQFDTLTAQSSILSPRSVIEYDGIYYWLGTDRMLMFNGVVREVPNNYNVDFFYDTLNRDHAQKVFAFKVPRFGEIWWCFPKDDATESNHAIILNVRENVWYDTPLPGAGRSAATFSPTISKPLASGVDALDYICTAAAVSAAGTGYAVGNVLTATGGTHSVPVELTVATVGGGGSIATVSVTNAGRYTATPTNPASITGGAGTGATFTLTFAQPYNLWAHEEGYDEVDGSDIQPIHSYFETGDISIPVNMPILNPPANRSLVVAAIEPDFNQIGDMTVTVTGRSNARADDVESDPVTFSEDEQLIHLKAQRRQLRFRFESNSVGGYYEMGMCLAHVRAGDGRTKT